MIAALEITPDTWHDQIFYNVLYREEGMTVPTEFKCTGTSHLTAPARHSLVYLSDPRLYGKIDRDIPHLILVPPEFAETANKQFDIAVCLPAINPEAMFGAIHNEIYKHVKYMPVQRDGMGTGIVMEQIHIEGAPTARGIHIDMNVHTDPGAVIGTEGFRIFKDHEGINRRLKHIGGVKIEPHAEIGASTVIDRGTFQDTHIGAYTKIDNNVHVGHNARIGDNCILAPGVVIGGSCEIGHDVTIWMGVQIRDGLKIGDNSTINMGSIVTRDVPANTVSAGFYARKASEWNKFQRTI